MTRKGSKAKANAVSPVRIQKIWETLTVDDWLSILNEFHPNNAWEQRGSSIRGSCPFHDDRSPSFWVNIDKGGYICYGESCHKNGWDPIGLFADLAQTSYGDAAKQLKNRFNIKLPNTFIQDAQKLDEHNRMKLALLDVMNQELVDALENPNDPEYAYLKETFAWIAERKLPGWVDSGTGYAPGEGVDLWPVGVLLPKEHLYDRMHENPVYAEYYEAAFKYLADYLKTDRYIGCLAFFFFVTPTTVGRIRLRAPHTKKYFAIDDPYNDEAGLFGLNTVYYMRQLGDSNKYRPIVVEGEIDQLAIYAHQVVRGETDLVPLAIGGGLTPSLEPLAVFKIDRVAFIGDKDPGGDGCVKRFIKDGHVEKVFTWAPEDYAIPQYKDIDGAIRYHGYEIMRERLLSPEAYLRSHEWMFQLFTRDLQGIDPKDIRARTALAGELAAFLRDVSERRAYITSAAEQLGIEERHINQATPAEIEDTRDLAFALQYRLEEEYAVLYTGTVGSDRVMLWHRKHKVERELPYGNKNKTLALLSFDIGNSQGFVEDEFGVPPCIAYTQSTNGPVAASDLQIERAITRALLRAVDQMVIDAPKKDNLTTLGQGVHYIPNFERGKPAVLIANGTKFFHGLIENGTVHYEELERPVCGSYYMKSDQLPWSTFINSVEDLKPEAAADFDLRSILEKVHGLFSTAWKFHHSDTDPWYLAADTVYTTVASVFGHMTMTELSGDTHSGKTKLMQVIGGNERGIQDIRLCEAVGSMDNYSEAAMRQSRGGSPIRLLLDEFENKQGQQDNYRNRAVQNILVSIRRLSAGSVVVRGTADGRPIRCELHFPLTVAGINATEEAYDVNRFVKIALVQQKGHPDPYHRVRELLSPEEFLRLRRHITLGLLCKIPQVLEAYESVRAEYAQNVGLAPGLDSRLKDNLLPSTAMLKLAGLDYQTYLARACRDKMIFLEKFGATRREHEVLWDSIFHTPIQLHQHAADLAGISSVARMVGDPTQYQLMNSVTDLGVYFFPEQKWLLVFWRRVAETILKQSNSFRHETNPGRLKTIADRHPDSIPQEILEAGNFLPLAGRMIGSQVNYDAFSVLHVQSIMLEKDASGNPGFADRMRQAGNEEPLDNDDLRGNYDELP